MLLVMGAPSFRTQLVKRLRESNLHVDDEGLAWYSAPTIVEAPHPAAVGEVAAAQAPAIPARRGHAWIEAGTVLVSSAIGLIVWRRNRSATPRGYVRILGASDSGAARTALQATTLPVSAAFSEGQYRFEHMDMCVNDEI